MADEDVFIFLSYAHDDDLATGASEDEVGFVTFLNKMLELKLRDLGATRAKIWIDRRRISDGDLFDDVIDDGLRKADLLASSCPPTGCSAPIAGRSSRRSPTCARTAASRTCRNEWSSSAKVMSTG